MTTPSSILVAVDFSEASAHAVSLAGSLAHQCGATVRLLHAEALEAPLYFTSEQMAALEAQRRNTRHQAEQYLARFGRTHTSHPVTAAISERPPADAILHAATTVDLVVMGTHGRRGAKRWWLGSVAEQVLRDVAVPLMIVRGDAPVTADAAFRRMVVHAAAPVQGAAALAYARTLAGCFHGDAVDARPEPIEPALATQQATLLVAAAPHPTTAAWLTGYGEPLVRSCRLPILFVPDSEGVPS